MTSQEGLVANVERLAESGHELMLDPDDENYNEPLDIEWHVGSDGDIRGMTLTMTVGGPHIELRLPSGRVEGWWGNDYVLRDMPTEMAKSLYGHFHELVPFYTIN